jgi:hypothetical protein
MERSLGAENTAIVFVQGIKPDVFLWELCSVVSIELASAFGFAHMYPVSHSVYNRGRCQFIQYIWVFLIFSHVPSAVWISFFHFRSDDRANMPSARSALFATVAEPCREFLEKRGLRLAINRLRDA